VWVDLVRHVLRIRFIGTIVTPKIKKLTKIEALLFRTKTVGTKIVRTKNVRTQNVRTKIVGTKIA
jgi:hypothetical protein